MNYIFKGERLLISSTIKKVDDNNSPQKIGDIKVYLNIIRIDCSVDRLEMEHISDNIYSIELDTNKYVGLCYLSISILENGSMIHTNQKVKLKINKLCQADTL